MSFSQKLENTSIKDLLIKFGFLDDVKSLRKKCLTERDYKETLLKEGIEKEKEILRKWLLEVIQDIINFIYEE